MKMRTFIIGAVMAAAVPGMSSAATFYIDQIITPSSVSLPTGVNGTASVEDAAPFSVGGYRELTVTRLSGTQSIELNVSGGDMNYSNGVGTRSVAAITWDGQGSTGLGGIDLMIGKNPYFEFDFTYVDLNLSYTLTVRDTASNISSFSGSSSGTSVEILPFSGFTGGADFTSIDSISLSLTAPVPSVDASLSQVLVQASTVPVPASLPLLACGVAGLAALRRRA